METRQCKQCSVTKSLDLFPLKKDNKTGKEFYRRTCSECYKVNESARVLNKYHTDPEYKQKTKDNNKKRVAQNPWYNKEAVSKRQKSNKDKVRTYTKKRVDNNRDKVNEISKRWQKNNRHKIREYEKQYSKTLIWNFIQRCKWRWKIAKKKLKLDDVINTHTIKASTFWEIINKQNAKCAISDEPLYIFNESTQQMEFVYTIDHILPLARWWLHDKDNLRFITPAVDKVLNYRTQ